MVVTPRRPDDSSLAYALLRVTLGLNIFMHGTTRLLAGIGNFVNGMIKMFQNTVLPTAVVAPFGYACLGWKRGSAFSLLLVFVLERLWSPVPF
jgi:thiosulfate dehydrogenase [quinone] large subunit